jgi:hypothetical protein
VRRQVVVIAARAGAVTIMGVMKRSRPAATSTREITTTASSGRNMPGRFSTRTIRSNVTYRT